MAAFDQFRNPCLFIGHDQEFTTKKRSKTFFYHIGGMGYHIFVTEISVNRIIGDKYI